MEGFAHRIELSQAGPLEPQPEPVDESVHSVGRLPFALRGDVEAQHRSEMHVRLPEPTPVRDPAPRDGEREIRIDPNREALLIADLEPAFSALEPLAVDRYLDDEQASALRRRLDVEDLDCAGASGLNRPQLREGCFLPRRDRHYVMRPKPTGAAAGAAPGRAFCVASFTSEFLADPLSLPEPARPQFSETGKVIGSGASSWVQRKWPESTSSL